MDFSRSKLTAHSLWLSAALSATFALSACTSDAPNAPERAEARVADALREHPNPAATHALTLQNQVLIANPGANNFDVDSLLTAQGPDLDASTFELADSTSDKGVALSVSGNAIVYNPDAAPSFGWDSFKYTVCDIDNDCGTARVQIVVQNGPQSCTNLALEETFKNSTADGTWHFEDNGTPVKLTASDNTDPEGDGWLRLTPITESRAGAALFDEKFYSHNGVSISFETASWGGAQEGGDGLLFFLVDGDQIDASNFQLGGSRGSLGYAPFENSSVTEAGMPHAVTAIAFDHWGGFWAGKEGRTGPDDHQGSTWEELPNSVVVRADADHDWKTLFVEQIDTATVDMSCSQSGGCNARPETLGKGRYRVSVVITPIANGSRFHLDVFVQSQEGEGFVQIVDTLIEQPLPEQLKLGFTGSSGGGLTAYHEIRNVAVHALVDAELSVSVSPTPVQPDAPVTYTYTLRNKGDRNICGANVQLQLPEGFNITSQSCETTSADSSCGQFSDLGTLQDIVALGAGDTTTITITGTASDPGDGSPATAGGTITPVDGQSDETPNDNSATVDTYYELSSHVKNNEDEVWVLTGTPTVAVEIETTQPAEITTISGPASGGTAVVDPSDPNALIFTPDDENATGSYEVTVTSCATAEPTNCSENIVTIVYNDPPTLQDETFILTPGSTNSVHVLNAADPGLEGTIDPSSLQLTSSATTANGTCTLHNGELTFAANANATPVVSDVCTVEICEEKPADACTSATYTFEIHDAFTPTDDTLNAAQGQESTVAIDDLLSNDGNIDETTFKLHESSATTGLSVSDDGQGNIVVTAAPDAPSAGSFTYEICSGVPGETTRCEDVTVQVTIAQTPVGTPNTTWTLENTPVDAPSPFAPTVVPNVDDSTAPGTASINPDGTIHFVPDAGFVGDVTLPVTGCTPTTPAACFTSEITVIVNDLPTLDDQTRIVTPGGSQTIDIVASADPGQVGDIDPSSAKLTSNASTANGTCAVQNGKLTFVANADAVLGAQDICTVEICEEQPDNACTSATYTFEIQDVFNPTEDELSTTQDTPMAFILDDLLQNDGNTDEDSFEIVFDEDPENPGVIPTTKGGTITYDDTTGEYTYTPPADFTGEDSFTYNVCSGLPNDDTCDEVEVTIVVHDLPTVEDTTIWVVTDTPSVDVPVQDLYSGGPIGSITPGAVEDEDGNPVGTVTVDGPTNTLIFTPNDPSAPAIYTFDAEVCDEADVCETTTITVIYNDPPNTEDPEIIVEPGTDKPVSFEELTRNSDKGDVDGGWDESSILVSNDLNGPFGQDADLGDDNACAIVDGNVVYTLADEVALGDNAPTCFVQICELDPGPAGTDTTNRACSTLDMTPTAGIEIVITGPQDGETLEADEPVTVTGTGEPGTEVTITIDGEDVGTTTVDEDGNWAFPLEDPLSPGDHTIVAEGENGSTDHVTVHVKDPADAETSIVINGPADGSTVPPNVTVHGKAEPFTPVKILVDGEEVGTVTTDGKGAWTFDLTDLELGEHTITAEDRNGDTDEVKVTVKDEDGEGDGNGEGLDGPDPNVASTGGRFLSCAATEPSAPTGGLVLLTLVVATFLARRRRDYI